jgi:hypothetical protein
MLKDNTVKLVSEFDDDDEISKCVPGRKDFASVKNTEEEFTNTNSYF